MEILIKNKGGRPIKVLSRTFRLRVACNKDELSIIKEKAQQTQISVSEFLRTAATGIHIDTRKFKALPKEVLQMTARLNHLAANINSLAYKNNRAENFNAIERAELKYLAEQVQQLTNDIKNYLLK
ncbi:MAG: mobilization protein [Bacteroidota bacterium]|nr:mobilization protein [Bacteroidota bacterium]